MKRRTSALAAAAIALSAASVPLLAGSANAATPVTTGFRLVYESDTGDDLVVYLAPHQEAVLRASGSVCDGWWFHGCDGPSGWVGNHAGGGWPLPGANTGELLWQFPGEGYNVLATGGTIYNFSSVSKPLMVRRNDNVPGNGSGRFEVDFSVYNMG